MNCPDSIEPETLTHLGCLSYSVFKDQFVVFNDIYYYIASAYLCQEFLKINFIFKN